MSRLSRATLRAGLAIGLTVGTAAVALAPAATPAGAVKPTPLPTIAGVLAPYAGGFDIDNNNFNIGTHVLLQFPDLVLAATKPGTSTVFLPTDYAFRALVKSLTGKVVVPEAAVLKAVLQLGPAKLGSIVRYHVLKGRQLTYAQALRAHGTVLTTMQGGKIRVSVVGTTRRFVVLADLAPKLPDAKIINANIRASNGLIHVIDRVMMPIAG